MSDANQKSASVSFQSGSKTWLRGRDDTLTMREVYNELKCPELFRLSYHFDPDILIDTSAGLDVTPSEVFEAKTSHPTTLFDTSNSVFNFGGLGGDASLNFGLGGENSSLHGFLPTTTAAVAGPLAEQFASENSFSAFLKMDSNGSPSMLAGPLDKPDASSSAKRFLF